MELFDNLMTPPSSFSSNHFFLMIGYEHESKKGENTLASYLKDPSEILNNQESNSFAAIEQIFAECSIINFSIRRTGGCKVDYEFKFFRGENLSLESIILEGKSTIDYGCCFSSPLLPNANIWLYKPGENELGKTFILGNSFSSIYLGNQFKGRTEYYSRCCCCIHSNIFDKNEKLLYITDTAKCGFSFMELIHNCCCFRPMYDIKLVTMYTADETHQPAFSIWKKSNCGPCCLCPGDVFIMT